MTALRHCPNGDGAFEAWVTSCLDCGAELVDEPPPPPPPPPPVDHSVTDLEVALSDQERTALQMLLTGDEIVHEWRGSLLRVPSVSVARVAERIAWVRRAGGIAGEAPAPVEPPAAVDTEIEWFDPPSFWRRGFGAVLDSMAAALVVLVGLAVTGSTSRWLGVTFVAVHQVVFVSMRGQTLGKRLVGTRVADLGDGRTPGVGQAALRWLVWGGALSTLSLLVHPPPGPTSLVDLAVVLPILKAPYHRGLHDLAARTIVTRV